MASIPFKPRESDLRELLKILKNEPDKPHPAYEQTLWQVAELRRNVLPDVKAYLGEIYHQLALRAQLRGDHARAVALYDQSISVFRSRSESLGLARVLRDKAMCIALHHDEAHGLTLALEALEAHKNDFDNPKGKRQELITQTYVWRIRAMVDPKQGLTDLVTVALDHHIHLNSRDDKAILEFLIPRVDAATRLRLRSRLAIVNAGHNRKIDAAKSLSAMMIDIPIVVTSRTIRLILRKE
ncbi:MAG TPA: hypothetical protein VGE13_02985 [Candidatus Saccharimonadales bacterium]